MRRKVIVCIICMITEDGSVCMCFGFFSQLSVFVSPQDVFFSDSALIQIVEFSTQVSSHPHLLFHDAKVVPAA